MLLELTDTAAATADTSTLHEIIDSLDSDRGIAYVVVIDCAEAAPRAFLDRPRCRYARDSTETKVRPRCTLSAAVAIWFVTPIVVASAASTDAQHRLAILPSRPPRPVGYCSSGWASAQPG
jgi:hypothetical protein